MLSKTNYFLKTNQDLYKNLKIRVELNNLFILLTLFLSILLIEFYFDTSITQNELSIYLKFILLT